MCHSNSILYRLYNLSVLVIAILHGCPSLHRGILIWLSFTRSPTVLYLLELHRKNNFQSQYWIFPSIDIGECSQFNIGVIGQFQIIIGIRNALSKQFTFTELKLAAFSPAASCAFLRHVLTPARCLQHRYYTTWI